MPNTIAQLEAFVFSPHYDAATSDAIAARIPALPSLKGEQISPGVTRIHGNLCNVHGRYGRCPGASTTAAPKPRKGRKPRKPKKIAQTPDEKRAAHATEQAQNRSAVLAGLNIAPDGQQALEALRSGQQPDGAAVARGGFEAAGLVERARDGSYRLSASGRAALSAASSGDAGRAGDIISSARDRATARGERTTAASQRRQTAAAKRERAAQARAERAKKPKKKRTRRNQSNRAAIARGLQTLRPATKSFILSPIAETAAPSFRVFKDITGRARWVAQSSTAYQDRDKEIVSTKALANDCAESDRTGIYGPLRWWHSPGLDLGDCDFNAMHGRVLIESGTFRTPTIAQKVAAAADALEISLGFLHLPTEPDASGVFHHMRKFERSLVPRGKASNLFTAFSVKERPMFDPTKVAALKALGFSDDDITSLQTQAEATEKAATDQQIAFKADEPRTPDLHAGAASGEYFINAGGTENMQPGQRFKTVNGDEYIKSPSELDPTGIYYARKAFPPKPTADPMMADAEDPAETADEGGIEEPGEEDAGGLTLSPEDIAAIGEAMGTALQAGIAQIMGALDLEKKVAGHVQGFMAPFQAQKDASDAEKAEQIAALQTSLKTTQDQLSELLGLQPAVTPRATETRSTALNPFNPADNALLQSIKEQLPVDQQQYANGFEDLKQKLFGP